MEKGNFKKAMSAIAEEYMEAFHAMTKGEKISVLPNSNLLSFSVDDFEAHYTSYDHDGTTEQAPLSYYMDIEDLAYFVENGIDLMTLRRWATYQCHVMELEVGEEPYGLQTFVENPQEIMKMAELNAIRKSGLWLKNREIEGKLLGFRMKHRPDYHKGGRQLSENRTQEGGTHCRPTDETTDG